MLKMILSQIKKYEEQIRYIVVGGLTTLVNLIVFGTMRFFEVGLLSSNTVAFIIAVLFAYVANKKYVFQDIEEVNIKNRINKFFKFVFMRIGSFGIETILLYLMVSYNIEEIISKILIAIIVIIVNYIISKKFIFLDSKNK